MRTPILCPTVLKSGLFPFLYTSSASAIWSRASPPTFAALDLGGPYKNNDHTIPYHIIGADLHTNTYTDTNMCIAGLNLTTRTCAHRWYELIRQCNPANSLHNCPEKLRLEGWERQRADCPFCDGTGHDHSTHRLFGSTSSASSVTSSPTMSAMGSFHDRYSRRSSGATATTGTTSALSRQNSNYSSSCSGELDRAIQARHMNRRIHVYLSSDPHEILPSATKNYPTYAAAIAKAESNAAGGRSEAKRLRRSNSFAVVSRGWQRMSKRLSINPDLFKVA